MNKTLNYITVEINLLIQRLKELQTDKKKLSDELQNNMYWIKNIKHQIKILTQASKILKEKINE